MSEHSMERQAAIHGLHYEVGQGPHFAEDIQGFHEACRLAGLQNNLNGMGCRTFYKITGSIDTMIQRSVDRTVNLAKISKADINAVIFSTSDMNLRWFDKGTVSKLFRSLELTAAYPLVLSLQQCASSLVAIDQGKKILFSSEVKNILFIFYDFIDSDHDRITPFGLCGDAVASLILNCDTSSGLIIGDHALAMDPAGLIGQSTFTSRKLVMQSVYDILLPRPKIERIDYFVGSNLYTPIAQLNMSMCGINKHKLYIETLPLYAHCGICDWLLNLHHLLNNSHIPAPGKLCLQASAPGFFAATIMDLVKTDWKISD